MLTIVSLIIITLLAACIGFVIMCYDAGAPTPPTDSQEG